jgi:Zn-dependent protease
LTGIMGPVEPLTTRERKRPRTRVRFTVSLWVVLAIGVVASFLLAPGPRAFVLAVGSVAAVLASLGAHELGHAWAAHRLGFHVTLVQVGVIDSATTYEADERSAPDRVLCAIAGPAASVAVATVLGLLAWVAEGHDGLSTRLAGFAAINLVLAVANLVPFGGTDGWDVIQGLRGRAD